MRCLIVILGVLVSACASGEPEEPVIEEAREWQRLDLAQLPGWVESAGPPLRVVMARAVLLRWWTDTCSFCERSLPALESLAQTYGSEGLAVVGVYHPKPRGRPFSAQEILEAARGYGFSGPIALDPQWEVLDEVWLKSGTRHATSVSFLVDMEGRVRHIHPGPELHPSDDPDHARCAQGYEAMERAIRELLDA